MSTPQPPADPAITAVAALDDELRRGMYTFIRRARRPITRDEAAASVGISRKLAAFHLDKLVSAGLLRARYEAVGGVRRVGRTPKVYEPAETDFQITIPERRHELLADILIDAVLSDPSSPTRQAAITAATTRGEQIGADERKLHKPGKLGPERALTIAEQILVRHGFEPTREAPTCIKLRNCPFHPLAARAPDLVCTLNHAFVSGFLTALASPGVRAVLAPHPGECCVELRG